MEMAQESRQPSCNIFLIGFMGAGKSTIAAELKRQLDLELVEMDQKIEEEQGMAITEIFSRYGENHFRCLETEMLAGLQGKANTVISCGGGIVVRPENQELMKKSGKVVLLTASPATVYERVKDSSDRPVLNGHMNVEYIASLQEKRRALYEAAADIVVATDHKTPEEICAEIERALV